MKTSILMLALGGCLAGATLVVGQTAPDNTKKPEKLTYPRIHFDQMVYDFGQTSMVQSLTGTFTFSNKGDGVLEVHKPSTSCGCTVAGVNPETVPPGGKGELTFTLNVTGIARGHVEKHITVPSNDNITPAVRLTIKTDLFSVIDLAPPQLVFGDLTKGDSSKTPVVIKRTDGKPLTITSTPTSAEMVKAAVERLDEFGPNAARVWIEVDGSGDPRRVSERVMIYGEDNSQPLAVIPVSGRIVGDIAISPEKVYWGIPDPDQWPGAFPELTTKRKFKVAVTDPAKRLTIKNIECSLRDMTATVRPLEEDKVYEITLSLSKAPRETQQGTVTFETDIPGYEKVTVGAYVNVFRRVIPEPPAATEATNKEEQQPGS